MDPREAVFGAHQPTARSTAAGDPSHSNSAIFSVRSKGYRTSLFDNLQLPKRVRKGWDQLAAQCSEPNPFFERWFISASDHLTAVDGGVRLAVVEDDDGLVGLLPLCQSRDYGHVPVRHVENWLHHNMFLGVPLIRTGFEKRFWTALIEALDSDRWAHGFLHLRSITEDGPVHRGLIAATQALGRDCPIVFRRLRPMLDTELGPDDYLQQQLSKKRRNEFNRRRRRLAEQGKLETRQLSRAAEVEPWCDAFLALEQAGWKGEAGSALNCCVDSSRFFHQVMSAAYAADRLHFLRLDLDGKPIAMLTSLLAAPGAFGFKSCFDQEFGRYSPGILLQMDNLALQGQSGITWQDSCAMPGHPIGSLWSAERSIVHLTIPLSGWRRRIIHAGARAIEEGIHRLGRLRSGAASQPGPKRAGAAS